MPATFRPATQLSTFRRIAASMWKKPADPSIYGFVDVDVSETLPFIEAFRARTGLRLTITHVVARAVAAAFAAHPELNAKVRLGGRIAQRSSIDLLVSVATEGGRDLAGARVDAADRLDFEELVARTNESVTRTRRGDDAHKKSRSFLGQAPWWLAGPALRATDFLTNELDLHLPSLGMQRDPFGTAVITNVGPFGIDTAFAPFVPLGRCPLLLLVTQVKERACVVDGRVEARPTLRLCATFDHRILDGYQAGKLAKIITARVADPGALPAAEAAA